MNSLKSILTLSLKLFSWLISILFATIILVIILIRIPAVQQEITDYAVEYLEDLLETRISVQKLFVTFDGDIMIKGLYVEDQQGDTLLHSSSLETGIEFSSLFQNEIAISEIDWQGVTANIQRPQDATAYNFSFIVEAFQSTDDAAPEEQQVEQGPGIAIQFGPIDLKDITFKFDDRGSGTLANVEIGHLMLSNKQISFDSLTFDLDEFVLEQTAIQVELTSGSIENQEDSAAATLPVITLSNARLDEIDFLFQDQLSGLELDVLVDSFEATSLLTDLNQQLVDFRSAALSQSSVSILTAENSTQQPDSSSSEFTWPDWRINGSEITMQENRFQFHVGAEKVVGSYFDPNHLDIELDQLQLNNVILAPGQLAIDIRTFEAGLSPVFSLKQLTTKVLINEQGISVDDLLLTTNVSTLDGNINIGYADLKTFIADPTALFLNANVDKLQIAAGDVSYFVPDIMLNEYFKAASVHDIFFSGNIVGSLDSISLDNVSLGWGQQTTFSVTASLTALDSLEIMDIRIPEFRFSTTKISLQPFLKAELLPDDFPENLQLMGSLQRTEKKVHTSIELASSLGNIKLSADATDMFGNAEYLADISFSNLNISALAKNDDLSPITGSLSLTGSGLAFPDINAEAELNLDDFSYREYKYVPFSITTTVNGNFVSLQTAIDDPNLKFELQTDATVDSLSQEFVLQLNLTGADFESLALTRDAIKLSALINVSYANREGEISLASSVQNGVAIRGSETYQLKDLDLVASLGANRSDFSIASGFLNGSIHANTSVEGAVSSLQNYLAGMLPEDTLDFVDKVDSTIVEANFKFVSSPLLGDVLVPGLTRLDTIRTSLSFRSNTQSLKASLNAPYMEFGSATLANLQLALDSEMDSSMFYIMFDSLAAGPLNISKTQLQAELINDTLQSNFTIADNDTEIVFGLAFSSNAIEDSIYIHLDRDKLILDRTPWRVETDNRIVIADRFLKFENISFYSKDQFLSINNQPENQYDDVNIDFKNFDLANVFAPFNLLETPISGMVNGEIELYKIFDVPRLEAGFKIDSLSIFEERMGTFKFEANRISADTFQLKSSLHGNPVDFDLDGSIFAKDDDNDIELQVHLDRLESQLLEKFSDGIIEKATGTLSGTFQVTGTSSAPDYQGDFHFNNASFLLDQINTPIRLSDEYLHFDRNGIYFDDFTILDEDSTVTNISGQIGTESFLNPTFDLSVEARDFQFLNTTAEDNKQYFGTLIMDLDATIQGDLLLPELDIKARLNNRSNLTYVVPESELELQERESLLMFFNAKDSARGIMKPDTENEATGIRGFSVKAILSIDPGTTFKIVLDEESGDFMQLVGEADLSYSLSPGGQMTLNGRYVFSSGSYEIKFYEVVQRKFEVVPGSIILWTGNPYDAELNLETMYRLRTSADELMADQLSGLGDATKANYSAALPFEIHLFIKGELANPDLSFALDMPQDERGALGGNVYAKLLQINENESQLNKQVFSLIVFNQFLPGEVASSEYSGRSSAARSSVNQILSSQLNNLSKKYIKGIELDFNLNSYKDYQSSGGQERTDLNVSLQKSLFDERVVLKVGSNVAVDGTEQNSENIIEDFSIEYLLSENGEYRLRAFRKNTFLDLVEGQIVITGLSLLFNREFNAINELFNGDKTKAQK